MELCRLEPELSGCNNEVAGLQSDCYTEVPLYVIRMKKLTRKCIAQNIFNTKMLLPMAFVTTYAGALECSEDTS